MPEPHRHAEGLPELPGPADDPDVICPRCAYPEGYECQEALCSPPCAHPHCVDPRADGGEFCRHHAADAAADAVELEVTEDDWQAVAEFAAGLTDSQVTRIMDSLEGRR